MPPTPIYLDNHATTRVDPRVVEAMAPLWVENYGNPASTSHEFGWRAKETIDAARRDIAQAIGARDKEIVFTSGATESNNLAIRGAADLPRRRGHKVISAATEHRAVLDPLARLARGDVEVTLLPVAPHESATPGLLSADDVAAAIDDETFLVSVMLANNEIGVIQPLAEMGALCKERGVLLHCDATQAVGKVPVDVESLQVDLMSFSAHKIYGPKGVGALYVRSRGPRVRLRPLIEGGGHENGLRSGTLNTPGIVGLAVALRLCRDELPEESARLAALRERLYAGLRAAVPDVLLNGPPLDATDSNGQLLRLPNNLNLSFPLVDGEALLMSMREVAVSSGSACTSANPEPSHVLRALGLSDDLTRSSLRFGLGRFNTDEEIDFAVEAVADAVKRLRSLSSMA